ncbi:hypothetical protein EmuJ_000710200 [Echinococcus multilocularis]|uniref:Uncharacterized protein n=1 Tax=Echinococcus multilocularis TaxID=6211 RepID=A0A068Y448_ECHMU|nr:hypothetical protein EmuJ_000710200 [Echinococcus multilocularis]
MGWREKTFPKCAANNIGVGAPHSNSVLRSLAVRLDMVREKSGGRSSGVPMKHTYIHIYICIYMHVLSRPCSRKIAKDVASDVLASAT